MWAAHALASGPPAAEQQRLRTWSTALRRSLLIAGDLAAVAAAMLATQHFAGALEASGRPLVWLIVLWMVWLAVARVLNLYGRRLLGRGGGALQRVLAASIVTLLAYECVPHWSPTSPGAGWPLALNLVLLLGGLIVWRLASSVLFSRARFRTRVLLLGNDPTIDAVRGLLGKLAAEDCDLLDVRADHATADGQATVEDLTMFVERAGIHELISGPTAQYSPATQAALLELGARGVTISTAADVYEALTGRSPLPASVGTWAFGSGKTVAVYSAVRSTIDVLVAAVGLVLFAPLILIAAIAVVLDSPGNPFYWQERVGRQGARFRILKLRTMHLEAEIDGCPIWAFDGDPRVTRVGILLRRSRLDEIPQLWNVLRGEMSLIGPRPERPEFVAVLANQEPLYRARHVLRPGITGWAQVQFGYAASVRDAVTKLEYDLYYIRHRSPVLDATILLKTLFVVLRLKGV